MYLNLKTEKNWSNSAKDVDQKLIRSSKKIEKKIGVSWRQSLNIMLSTVFKNNSNKMTRKF